jgi:hypothetical protein
MQPNPYNYNPHPYNPYANGAQMPVRYSIPPGYGQNSPPYANQYDRYAAIPAAVYPAQNVPQPVRYPPGYRTGQSSAASTMTPVGISPRPQQPPKQLEQLQPPQPYYYNPYGANGKTPAPPPPPSPKKGAKEYKDNAFTIAPDGPHSESIKGLVSNNDINELLKHKGTKVKVSKIYRITKTKPNIVNDDSSDEELPIRVPQPLPPPPPPLPAPIQRPISSSSSDSHCSTCSNCSCSNCRSRSRDRRRSHGYDDCPECRAELNREQARRQRRK